MLADLDGLKRVNDSLGHGVGDHMIQQAAQMFRQAVRGDDVAARLGGDEYAIILPVTDAVAAHEVKNRIRESEALFNQEHRDYVIGISIGIATAEQGGSLVESLRLADQRMYEDKRVRKQAGAPEQRERE